MYRLLRAAAIISAAFWICFAASAAVGALAGEAGGQDVVHVHPLLDFQVTLGPGWEVVARPEDNLIHHLRDPGSGINAVLWSTSTGQDARRYAGKMAHMKDMDAGPEKPAPMRLGEREAWGFDCPATELGDEVRLILAVADVGRSHARPRENILRVLMVWCPAEREDECRPRMERILAGARAGGPADFE